MSRDAAWISLLISVPFISSLVFQYMGARPTTWVSVQINKLNPAVLAVCIIVLLSGPELYLLQSASKDQSNVVPNLLSLIVLVFVEAFCWSLCPRIEKRKEAAKQKVEQAAGG